MEWRVGDVRIVKVVEFESAVDLSTLFPLFEPSTAKRHPWLWPDFIDEDGLGRMSVHALVVDTGERRIMVDTCIGAHRENLIVPPLDEAFLDHLAAAGYSIDVIDTVLCTHLHFDHVGWNTRLVDGAWVPTFPRARYLIGRRDWEHWRNAAHDPGICNIAETVRPVVEAGLVDLVDTTHQVCPEVRLVPTPGHTPGHVSVVVESRGERAVITGDLAHHPVQYGEPDLGMYADHEASVAASTRRSFLSERAQDGALVIGTHFATPTAGVVRAEGTSFRFDT
jgi:glyoxylase-like metal-dependent hydrolase (beta-lactamase superfamily II)